MRNLFKTFVLLLLIFIIPTGTAKAAVKLNTANAEIKVGETLLLKVTGTKKKVKWSSSNKQVATVTKKGKVTAKQVGSATITAKVAKKTFRCYVTVESNFSASEATEKISCTLQDTGKGVVAILKNNNEITVKISAKMAYYSGGIMIGTRSDDNYAFESGEECALFFYAPHDADYHDVEYDDYKITLSVEEGGSSLVCDSNGIEVTEDFGTDNISAEIKNNSGKTLNSVLVSCVFYDSSNNAIGYDNHYAECKTDGSIDFITFNFPHDENYKTIYPSDYKIYVNSAYSYDWEL